MKKLKKNFENQKMTVEAMADSCMNGCSCSYMNCGECGTNPTKYTSVYKNQYTTRKNIFRDAGW